MLKSSLNIFLIKLLNMTRHISVKAVLFRISFLTFFYIVVVHNGCCYTNQLENTYSCTNQYFHETNLSNYLLQYEEWLIVMKQQININQLCSFPSALRSVSASFQLFCFGFVAHNIPILI